MMATTYRAFINKVQTLIDRDDASTVTAENGDVLNWLDEAARNAELRFYRSEAARIPPFEKVTSFTVEPGSQTLAIPSDYFSGRYALSSATGSNDTFTLTKTSPEQLLNENSSSEYLNVTEIAYGSNNWIIPRPSRETKIDVYYYGYLEDIINVDDDFGDHWLLNNADDLLLYWTAYELSMFYGGIDPTMADRWLAQGNAIHDAIIKQEAQQKASLSTPRRGRPYKT